MATNNPYALSFDGVDDYAKLQSDIELDGDYTIEFWLKPQEPLHNSAIFVFDYNNIGLIFRSGQYTFMQNSQRFGFGLNDYEYSHVALVRESGNLKVYVDGIEITSEYPYTAGYIYENGSYIGRSNYEYASFQIDEFRVWDYARSQDQVQNQMNSNISGVEEGILAYFRFDDNSDTSLFSDITENGYSGDITGASYVTGEIDLDPPPVALKTTDVTNVSGSSATLNGEILSLGSETQLDVAFQYSPDPEFATNIQQTPYQTISSPQSISADVSGLDTSTGYYVRMTAEGS